jgi:hypothetical protein
MENRTMYIDSKDLKFNPIYTLIAEFSNWEYTCMQTEVAVYGILKPIIISKNNVVIDGNKRLQACRELKIEKVPVQIYSEQDKITYLLSKELKPSVLISLIDFFEKKYNLKAGGRIKTSSIATVIRKLFLGDSKRISQLMTLKKLSTSVISTYPSETEEIWRELDGFNITIEQGINKMKDLYQRKTTINFLLEYKMAA